MRQKGIIVVLAIIVLIGGVLGIRHLIFGGAYPVAVAPTSIEDQISQAVTSKQMLDNTAVVTSNDERPPRVENVVYFDDKQWVMADIVPQAENSQTTSVIMKREGTKYVIALGPGTDFANDIVKSLHPPDDLFEYLDNNGYLSVLEDQ